MKTKPKKTKAELKRLGVTRKARTPAAGSLAWYRASWREALGPRFPESAVDEMARLSYENQALRKRLATCEAVLVSMTTGMFEVKGEMHLLGCSTRDGRKCSCGSQGPREESRKGN